MKTSETIGAIACAIAKAQLSVRNPKFDKKNPHYNSKYASLAAHLDSLRMPFAENGLAVMQGISTANSSVSVETLLSHASGEWISCEMSMAFAEKSNAQQIASLISYLRRYSLASMGMLVGDDDDDDADSDRVQREEERKPAPKPAAKAAPKPAPAPATAVAQLLDPNPRTEMGKNGCDILRAEKIRDRGNGISAVQFANEAGQSEWIAVPNSYLASLKIGKAVEVSWVWNMAGYREIATIDPVGDSK
jgi:hypothetical protein